LGSGDLWLGGREAGPSPFDFAQDQDDTFKNEARMTTKNRQRQKQILYGNDNQKSKGDDFEGSGTQTFAGL
jgi:hypothetical protein